MENIHNARHSPVASDEPDQEAKDTTASNKGFLGKLRNHNPRFLMLASLAILVIVAIVLIPVVMIGVTARAARRPKPVGDEDHKITSPSSPGYKDPFNDSAKPNPFTPPLNQSFDYNGRDRIRGINLGGWLVLEPFITPKIFEQLIPGYETAAPVVDEWTLTERLGPVEAKRQLKEHYETFITENDFKKIADMGFNHVRIPTGHWALQVFPGEPFVPHLSWQYLLKGIQWARKYGLRVMVELHTAPGSQNGWNHSGREGQVGFLNGTEGQLNAERTIQIVMDMVQFFDRPEWSHVVPIFGVLNEPAMMKIPEDDVKEWYQKSHDTIRKTLGPGKGPLLTYHDGFLPLPRWKGFFGKRFDRTVLETHLYLIFNKDLVAMPRDVQADFPCNFWRRDLNESTLSTGPTMVGEFSVATNDCGKYLNGIGLGSRFDGTLDQGDGPAVPVCPTCTCKGVDDWKKFTPEYKTFLLKFMQKQMDAYETGIGWFYWTYKTQDHVNPHWDYLLAWEQGFAPKDVNNREYSCGPAGEGQQQ